MSGDPAGALRLRLWGGDRVHWPGYEPWREVVLRSRRELLAAARPLCLLPEILSPLVRDDVAILHGFCREVDDTVDEAPTVEAASARLSRLEDELLARAPARPLVAALLAGAPRMGFPREAVLALLEGVRGDVGPVRVADDAELLRYCYRVSASVGLLLCPVLGVPRRAWPHAVDLGIGLQLSNILLGVEEDAGRDRVYIPRTRLSGAGLTAEDLLSGTGADRLPRVLLGLAALADRYYASADEGIGAIPWRYRHGVIVMSRLYARLGLRAAAQGGTARPLTAGAADKTGALIGALAVSLTPRMLGLARPRPHERGLHVAIAGWPGTETES